MKKDSPSLLACVSRTFKVHFWDNLMAASHLGLQGLLRLCSGRRRHRRPAAKPWWGGRYMPALEMLEPRLQPAGLPTFYPTGVDNSGALLGTGVTDPHYAIVARPWPLTDTTSRTVTPATGWVANDSDSRWITPTSSGFQGVNAGGYYTYRTTVDFTGYAPGSIVLSGKWAADDFAVITVNGSPTPSAAIYYPAWGSLQSFTLDYSNSTFFSGVNTIDFTVGNYYNSTGLRVDHVSVQASQQRGSDPERALRVPVGQALVDLNTGSLRVQQPLDFDQSPGTGVGGSPALVYNSSTVSVKPIVETLVNTSLGMPAATSIQVTLTINGGTPTVQTFTPTGPAGSSYVLAVQDSTAITDTDRYPYSVDVQVTYTGGGVVTAPTVYGNVNVVARDSSPYGAGWSIAGVDALITSTVSGDGVLWVTGAGDSRFFAFNGSGGFISPAEDFGTLALSGGTYTYTGTDGTQWKFNSSGQLANVVTPDTRTTTYSYTSTSGPLQEVDSSDGGVTTLAYSSALATIYESGGRTVSTSVNGGSGELDSLTDENGETRGFSYGSGHRLSQDQWSPLDAAFAYDAYGLVTSVDRGLSGVYSMAAAVGKPLVTSPALGAGAQGQATWNEPLSGHTTTYTLDSRGRALSEVAADGSMHSWTRNSSGQPLVYTDPLNRQTQYAYSAAGYSGFHPQGGDLTTITYADGTQDKYSYNTSFHKPVSHIDRKGRTTNYLYTAAGLMTGVKDALNNETKYLLDARGNVTQTIDARTNPTYFAYDGSDRLVERTDALGGLSTWIYDTAGNATVAIDAMGRAVTTLYDGQGRVTSVTRPGNATPATMVYNAIGYVVDQTDAMGRRSTFAYDQQGRLAFTTLAVGTDAEASTYRYYDAAGNVTGSRDGNGNLTSYTLDALNRVTVTTVAAGTGVAATSYQYFDLAGRITGVRDANTHLTTYALDLMDRMTSTTTAAGTGVAATNYRYFDQVGNVTGTRDGRGILASMAYDALNRVTATTTAAGTGLAVTTLYFYDEVGNMTGTLDDESHLVQSLFDAKNRVTQTIDGQGKASFASYNFADELITVTDANNNVTHFTRDGQGRVTITATAAATTHDAYDANGNRTAQTDGNGKITTFLYDGQNRLYETEDARNYRVTQFYDAVGNVTYVKDAKNNVTTFGYDEQNRRIRATDPLGMTTFTYDSLGLLTSEKDRLGRRRDFAYDAQNRLTTETWYATVTATNALATMTASYDENGNQLTAGSAAGIYTMQYDALNRVTGVLEPFNQRLTFSYDGDGNRTEVRDSLGGIETSIYDEDHQLETRTLGLAGTTMEAGFTYLDNGLLETLTRSNDTGGGMNVAGATSYLYDGVNRMTGINAYDSGNTLRTSFVYNYDDADNLTSKVDNGATVGYTYTLDNQLFGDGTSTYDLDGAGNRTSGPGGAYGVDTANRVTSSHAGDWIYRYDAEGNQTATLSNTNSTWWTYDYDHRNQLTSAKKWNANPEVPGTPLVTKEVAYKYDWYGNRVQTDVDNDGDSDIDSTEKYALDYWNGSGHANVWADLDGGGSLTTRYLRGDGADELLGRADSGGTPSWLLTDHLGSVRNVTDSTGALTATVTYDAWGNTSDTAGVAGRYQWTGRERDVETGLQYNRARWYDASTGRWMSQDPLGFDAGDSNLYRYVRNRQTGATDPSGLQQRPGQQNNRSGWSAFLHSLSESYESITDGLAGAYLRVAPASMGGNTAAGKELLNRAYDRGPFGQTDNGPAWAKYTTRGAIGVATVATGAAVLVGAGEFLFLGNQSIPASVLWGGSRTPGQMEIDRMRQFLQEGHAEMNDMIRARDALFQQGDIGLARIQDKLIQNVQKNLASIEEILDLYIKLFGK